MVANTTGGVSGQAETWNSLEEEEEQSHEAGEELHGRRSQLESSEVKIDLNILLM